MEGAHLKDKDIMQLLIENDEIVKHGMLSICKCQKDNYQSEIYNNLDYQIFSNYLNQINKGEPLTKNQMFIARKRILKYTPQLTKVVNQILVKH